MNIQKTLFVSDMDGTLLNSNAKISENSIEILNSLIAKGLQFTVATARTAATVVQMLENVNINIPVILMNGVCIYDIKNHIYIKKEVIPTESVEYLISCLKNHSKTGFLYSISNDLLYTFYEQIYSKQAEKFMSERINHFGKVFTKVDTFSECIDWDIVYFSVSDYKSELEPLYLDLKKCKDIHIEFYRDIYDEDSWYLEVCSKTASKFNALNELKKLLSAEYAIGFGDNLNDIPLFRACDESYAVENAKHEVKSNSSAVIQSNNDDGVATYLQAIMVEKLHSI